MSPLDVAYGLSLALSALWFGAAFRFFSLQNVNAAKVLVPRPHRDEPLFDSIAAFSPFLGGFNAAMAVLCAALTILLAVGSDLFTSGAERGLLLLVAGIAHLSQFWFNVPVLKTRRRRPDALWPVTTGPMRRIFVVDFSLAVLVLGSALPVTFS